jgi:hypothetical protein
LISDYKLDLDLIADLHDGNVTEWFNDLVEESKDQLEDQKKML